MVPHLELPSSVGRFALVAWFGVMLVLGAGLLAKHVVPFKVPAKNQQLTSSLAALRSPAGQGKWLAVHVLYAECRCSQRLASHLASSKRPSGWEEIVLWAGKAAPDPVLAERYRVKTVTSAELSRLGIAAAPLLVVLGPDNNLRYLGGYSAQKQGPVLDDLRILSEVKGTTTLASMPIFGCAVSKQLQRELSIFPGL